MQLGPFDKRTRKKRCTECRVRHLKCEGIPCALCIRENRKCMLPPSQKRIISLERINSPMNLAHDTIISLAVPGISKSLQPELHDRVVVQFCNSFLESNSFTGKPIDSDMNSMIQSSLGLSDAAKAIGSLYVRRQHKNQYGTEMNPLRFYAAGLSSLREDLRDSNMRRNISVLWSSFFLGLFELMYDVSGLGWTKHFNGTSDILQYFGPEACLSGVGQKFFLTIRIFEISRALLFTEKTFLSEKKWQDLMAHIWDTRDIENWHPKEQLFDIMVSCSSLRCRGLKMIEELPHLSTTKLDNELQAIANEGLVLQSALYNWEVTAKSWQQTGGTYTTDDQMTLSFIYFNTTTILLSGIFDYFPYWDDRLILTPTISRSNTQECVCTILSLITIALQQRRLAGILFMVPLRVAGARASTVEQKTTIAAILEEISYRGFVAADAIALDLKDS